MWPLVLTSLVLGLVPVVPWLSASLLSSLAHLVSFLSTLSMAHLGYLQWDDPFLCGRTSGLLQTVFALWVNVWITCYFADRWWWLSHGRYCSVWVGFLYTVIDRLPSLSGLTMVSKNGMAPSSLLSPTVNFMTRTILLMCSRKFCLFSSLGWHLYHTHTYATFYGGGWQYLTAYCSMYSISRLAKMGLTGATPSTCSWNWPWKEK